MPSANNEEQFKFLISCIRNANNSKVDFSAVARECGIVTKGAAAKRYERMMKAHGIATNGSSARSTSGPTGSKRDNTASSKKRKLDQFGGDQGSYPVDDDDEGNCKVKNELEVEGVKESIIKAEEDLVVDAVQDSPIPDSGTLSVGPASDFGPPEIDGQTVLGQPVDNTSAEGQIVKAPADEAQELNDSIIVSE